MTQIHYYNQKCEERIAKLPLKCKNKSIRWYLDKDYQGEGIRIIFENYFTGEKISTKVLKNCCCYGIFIE